MSDSVEMGVSVCSGCADDVSRMDAVTVVIQPLYVTICGRPVLLGLSLIDVPLQNQDGPYWTSKGPRNGNLYPKRSAETPRTFNNCE